MDFETIQALVSQGVAVGIVIAIGVGIAHYWLKHGLPNKVAKDAADLKLSEQTCDSLERLTTSFETMGGDVRAIDGRLGNVETDLEEVKRRTGRWVSDGSGGLKPEGE